MQLVINNLTGSTRTYLSGVVSVVGNGSTSITNTTQQLALATDGILRSDIFANLASISDGTNPFGTSDAINYLYEIIQVLGPLSDGLGNNLTSTLLGGKQRLDMISPSEGTDGATSPTYTTQIGGKDSGGNLQTLLTDTSGAVITSSRAPLIGSSPTAATIGTSSGTVIATNASRRGLVVINTSNSIVSLNIVGGAAVLRSGITLYPGGIWYMDEYTFTTGAVNGIASAASSNLALQELT